MASSEVKGRKRTYRLAEGIGDLFDDGLFTLLDERLRFDVVHLVESKEQRRVVLLRQRDGGMNHLATEVRERNGTVNDLRKESV